MSSPIELSGVHVAHELVCIEGLDSERIHSVCEYLSKFESIAVPYLFQIANDKAIKQALFHKVGKIRDARSEAMCVLANRRTCMAVAANTVQGNIAHLVFRMHLLSSFSSLRDDNFPVERWVDYVLLTFEDAMPGKFVVIGNSQDTSNRIIQRRSDDVDRDYSRRIQALNALVKRVPSIKVLVVDDPQSESLRVCNFIVGETP